jgi:hypothetical protein
MATLSKALTEDVDDELTYQLLTSQTLRLCRVCYETVSPWAKSCPGCRHAFVAVAAPAVQAPIRRSGGGAAASGIRFVGILFSVFLSVFLGLVKFMSREARR